MCSQGSNWQYSSIGSDNGLSPARDKPLSEPMIVICWSIYVSLSLNEFRSSSFLQFLLITVWWPTMTQANDDISPFITSGCFKNVFLLLNLRALKIPMLYKNFVFQCMGEIFCVEFQRYPFKFHTKYLTHTLEYLYFICGWTFRTS